MDFNPRAPCGARLRDYGSWTVTLRFQSTRPVWGATIGPASRMGFVDISIHAPRVGRDPSRYLSTLILPISIHAPRVGRDLASWYTILAKVYFNPRAPCGARQAEAGGGARSCQNFNPRAPCGARPSRTFTLRTGLSYISIHAPRVGRDQWRALHVGAYYAISIHAPRVGRDKQVGYVITGKAISIHAPRVGRDFDILRKKVIAYLFQSTRPVWGATANLTILPRQICTKGTKEFLLGRKTHGKKGKIK